MASVKILKYYNIAWSTQDIGLLKEIFQTSLSFSYSSIVEPKRDFETDSFDDFMKRFFLPWSQIAKRENTKVINFTLTDKTSKNGENGLILTEYEIIQPQLITIDGKEKLIDMKVKIEETFLFDKKTENFIDYYFICKSKSQVEKEELLKN